MPPGKKRWFSKETTIAKKKIQRTILSTFGRLFPKSGKRKRRRERRRERRAKIYQDRLRFFSGAYSQTYVGLGLYVGHDHVVIIFHKTKTDR